VEVVASLAIVQVPFFVISFSYVAITCTGRGQPKDVDGEIHSKYFLQYWRYY
jgi:hypothetical protein